MDETTERKREPYMFKQLVPLDGSERAERAVRVAERIARTSGSRFAEVALAPARELARAFGSRILLVRCPRMACPVFCPLGFPISQV